MRRTFTQQPIVPIGYTGQNFNRWQKHLQKQIDKVKGTTVSQRMNHAEKAVTSGAL